MGISKCWGKAVVVAGCLSVMASAAHAGYDENVGAATDSSSSNMGGSMSGSDMRMRNAQMLIQTLSEEKTEINSLAAQREMFLRMGGSQNRRIARLWLRWINEHKAGSPTLMRLIRRNGGDPTAARILKAPPLGTREQMLMATHRDHMAAVMTSQMRFGMTYSPSIKAAMHKRANLARKHIRQMRPFHSGMMNGNMSGGMNNGMSTSSGGMDMNNDASMDNTTTMDNSTDSTTTTTTTDTTATDSGTMDSGTTDNTTTDSTTTDTTTTDSTTTTTTDNTTATDSGTMDGGTTDSTTTDGGTMDGATSDDGTTDGETSGMDTKGADAAGEPGSTMNQ